MEEKPQRRRDKGLDGFRGDWGKRGDAQSVPLAYSPKQLCRVVGISLTLLYEAWKQDKGPKYARLNSRRIITHDDAMEWLDELKAATTPETEKARAEVAVPLARRAGKCSGAKRKSAA